MRVATRHSVQKCMRSVVRPGLRSLPFVKTVDVELSAITQQEQETTKAGRNCLSVSADMYSQQKSSNFRMRYGYHGT